MVFDCQPLPGKCLCVEVNPVTCTLSWLKPQLQPWRFLTSTCSSCLFHFVCAKHGISLSSLSEHLYPAYLPRDCILSQVQTSYLTTPRPALIFNVILFVQLKSHSNQKGILPPSLAEPQGFKLPIAVLGEPSRWFGWSLCVWDRTVMGTGAIKADWGQSGRPQSGEASGIPPLLPQSHANISAQH